MKRKLNRVKGMSRVLTAAFFTALIAAAGSSSGLRHETAPLPTSINPAIGTNVQIASPPAVPLAKEYEAISLFGVKLVSPAPNPAALQRYEQARRDFTAAPTEDNYVWLGRRPPNDVFLLRKTRPYSRIRGPDGTSSRIRIRPRRKNRGQPSVA